MLPCACALDSAQFEYGKRDYARRTKATTEKCIDQTATGEKAKIRKCTSKDSCSV